MEFPCLRALFIKIRGWSNSSKTAGLCYSYLNLILNNLVEEFALTRMYLSYKILPRAVDVIIPFWTEQTVLNLCLYLIQILMIRSNSALIQNDNFYK